MCYDEWKSIDILYNCDENCFQNDHFDQCRKSMNSIPREMKEWISSLVKPLHDSQSFGSQASVDHQSFPVLPHNLWKMTKTGDDKTRL